MNPPITVTLSEDQIALVIKVLNEVPITGLHIQQLSVATATMLQNAVQASKAPPPPAPELEAEDIAEEAAGIGMTPSTNGKSRKKMAGGQ